MIFLFQFLKELAFSSFWNAWAVGLLKDAHTLSETALALGIFFLASSLVEVPTGVLADKYGKRLITIIGLFFSAAGFSMIAINSNGIYSLTGFSLIGFGYTCVSGAAIAWMLQISRNNLNFDSTKFFFNIDIVGRISTLIGSFVSIYLLDKSPTLMWYGFCIVAFLAGLFAFFLKKDSKENHLTKKLIEIKDLVPLFKNKSLVLIFLSAAFFGIEGGTRNVIAQPFILSLNKNHLYSLAFFTVSLSLVRLCGALFYKYKLHKYNKMVEMAALSFVIFAISQFVAGLTTQFYVFLFFYWIAIFSLGWYFPIKDTYLNSLSIPP